ncbi:multidrug transporter [Syntrophotalea acetylenivorans]|uniref:Multidrug transporter n=1 Tax=Syntrophotalea acetylenivorans TaxID=1842532 RepID=A0A1L3GMF4_9BACT|nr:signal peptide peptidase SppA [Syntrophotalea acetylenivorans]APG27113.1 multidrug transporter [Syntrophotalea acetylenivorans]
MKKRPFLMALLTLGAIFAFFLLLIVVVGKMSGRSSHFVLGEKVGYVTITGAITSSEKIIEQIDNFKEDSSVKAIVLRVNSPGGGVSPSQEIYDEVKATAAVKPVVVSMGSVAASGGYYIAAPAQRILANPGTITGSIGVIMQFTNVEELLGKVGLKSQVVKSGKHKDIGSPVRPMSGADREILQSLIDDVYSQFVQAVAESRKMEIDKVRQLADGRIFTGRQAFEAGLVDELGGYRDAIRVAADLAGIEGKPKVVYPAPDKPEIFEYFVQETAQLVKQSLQNGDAGLQFLWSGK